MRCNTIDKSTPNGKRMSTNVIHEQKQWSLQVISQFHMYRHLLRSVPALEIGQVGHKIHQTFLLTTGAIAAAQLHWLSALAAPPSSSWIHNHNITKHGCKQQGMNTSTLALRLSWTCLGYATSNCQKTKMWIHLSLCGSWIWNKPCEKWAIFMHSSYTCKWKYAKEHAFTPCLYTPFVWSYIKAPECS